MKNKTSIYKTAAVAALLAANQFALPVFADETDPTVVTDQTGNEGDSENPGGQPEVTDPSDDGQYTGSDAGENQEPAGPDADAQGADGSAAADAVQAGTLNNTAGQTVRNSGTGSAVYNGATYATVQEAVDAIGENGTGTIDVHGEVHDQAVVKKGQTVTFNIAEGTVWDNSETKATGWGASVITNYGTVTVNNKGTVKTANGKPGFAACNETGGIMNLTGGLFTTENGDYVIYNHGEMNLDSLKVDKTKTGSPTAVHNGYRHDNPPEGAPTAKMTLKDVTVVAETGNGIAIKNDTWGEMTIDSGDYTGAVCPIQNTHKITVNGGKFTVRGNGGYGIANSPLSGSKKDLGVGQITITGGDFYADYPDNATIIRQMSSSNVEKPIQISGGSYWADQANVKDNVIPPYVLRQSRKDPARWVVEIPVTSIDLKADSTVTFAGDSLKISAAVNPENATYPQVTWSVDNAGLAEIEGAAGSAQNLSDATLKALKPGTVKVIAEADGVTQEIEILIREKMTLTVTPDKASLFAGETVDLKAQTAPEEYKDAVITWTSSDPEIAEVDENGTVKALKPGKVTITATAEEKAPSSRTDDETSAAALQTATAQAEIEVRKASITLDPSEVTLKKGSSEKLKAVIEPEELKDEELVWKSSDSKVVKVSKDGTIKGLKVGEAEITVSLKDYPDVKATAKVTVTSKTTAGSSSSSKAKKSAKKSSSSKTAAAFGAGASALAAAASAAGIFLLSKKRKK